MYESGQIETIMVENNYYFCFQCLILICKHNLLRKIINKKFLDIIIFYIIIIINKTLKIMVEKLDLNNKKSKLSHCLPKKDNHISNRKKRKRNNNPISNGTKNHPFN